jgi:hypothetical protein
MYRMLWIAFILGGLALLGAALLRVFRDLVVRGPYEAPLLDDEASIWPSRQPESAESVPAHARSGSWRTDGDRANPASPP